MSEIFGSIDVGTGSVLCLAVEKTTDGKMRELLNESVITALGAGTASDPSVRRKSIERTLKPVIEYVQKLKDVGATSISVVGTSALRKAPNRQEFINEVHDATGVEVEVISGDEEALLTFWGATHGLSNYAGPVVVMDVGGGSSELVFGHPRVGEDGSPAKPELAVSLPIGSLVLTDRFITNYPTVPDEMARLRDGIRAEFENTQAQRIILTTKDVKMSPLMVGVGGSATTLVAMEHEIVPYIPMRVHKARVPRDTIQKHIERLGAMSLEERYAVPGLPKGRAPVIDAGLSILHELLGAFGQEAMTVSDHGLRYGVIVRDVWRSRSAPE
ncbi:MAG: Ppx/GppA family phosphatase [Candidatus Coatesbacteria bacterium]|nr:Ppx/GppA family phosphatase [Candidatus Coatesbacteria bacterium]